MNGLFLQSSEWEQIHRQIGRTTWRVRGILIVQHTLPLGFNYLYCPRPVFDGISMLDFLADVSKIAQKEKSLFLKIDPVEKIFLPATRMHLGKGEPLQPQYTMVLDLSKSEDELLKVMHEKTRYNIRLAGRKDLEVVQILHREAKEDMEIFLQLLSQTASRAGFYLHDKHYYELLRSTRTAAMSNEFFFVRMRNNYDIVLGVALINIYKNPHTGVITATYLHGGSLRDYRELMAPYFLHWCIIQEMKRRGAAYYDLWGTDEKRWPGVTRFKTGFSGSRITYPPSIHVIYRSLWYGAYVTAQFFKKH